MALVVAPEGSSLTPEALATAEAVVAAHLGLPEGLQEQTGVAESGSIGTSGLIILKRPATSIQTLTVAGAPAIGVLRNPRTLDATGGTFRPYIGNTYAALPYQVTYTAGWTADTLPEPVRQAVLATASTLAAEASRAGVKSETMGPVSYTYVTSSERPSFTSTTLDLLRPWLPLVF